MDILNNPYRGVGLPGLWAGAPVYPSVDETACRDFVASSDAPGATPLLDQADMARDLGLGHLHIKDEGARMGLGSFKALGAAYVISTEAAKGDLSGRVFIAASAGNHGLSVAAGAARYGARAVIVLAETVPEGFAERLRGIGAEVLRAGAIYEDSMAEAQRLADANGWTLLSDSSWPGYTDLPYLVMEGYLQMAAEAVEQMPEMPSHIMLQAGVGGLAAAVAAYARKVWGDTPQIIVVEPEFAPALIESMRAGKVVIADGPVSDMGRLDCKEPSLIALTGLARDADMFVTISEAQAADAVARLAGVGISTTPSGAAGVAAAIYGGSDLGLTEASRVLTFVSEIGE